MTIIVLSERLMPLSYDFNEIVFDRASCYTLLQICEDLIIYPEVPVVKNLAR
jgi:hypothetical protein